MHNKLLNLTFILALLIFVAGAELNAQGFGRGRKRTKSQKKKKKPYLFGDPKNAGSTPMLKIDYLAQRPQGSVVWLRMMSGNRVKGILMNVQSESGVIILRFPDAAKGKAQHGSFKASALEGVDY